MLADELTFAPAHSWKQLFICFCPFFSFFLSLNLHRTISRPVLVLSRRKFRKSHLSRQHTAVATLHPYILLRGRIQRLEWMGIYQSPTVIVLYFVRWEKVNNQLSNPDISMWINPVCMYEACTVHVPVCLSLSAFSYISLLNQFPSNGSLDGSYVDARNACSWASIGRAYGRERWVDISIWSKAV